VTAARLVARTVRGIEDVVATEIRHRKLGRIDHIGHREVLFRCAEPSAALTLRTADDVFLVAAELTGVGHTKADLRLLAEAAEAVPVHHLLHLRERCGGSPVVPGIDVSASFLGRRNYTRYDVEDAVGTPLAAALTVPYRTRRAGRIPPPGGLSWRVTITDDRALLALRIAGLPLHRRPYRVRSRPGSLHPPLAAAMVSLAAPHPGATVLDPFCGTGTIPIEAGLVHRSLRIVAGDRDPAALASAVTNAGTLPISWTTADAACLPLAGGAVDLVVTNPPWARQVRPTGALSRNPGRFWLELRRVLRPDGRALLLLPDADEHLAGAARAGLTVMTRRPVSLSGLHPEVVELR
jgi:23S rRNA G2445 N2-methylase RlmL